jgi:hypothetical protein
MSAIVCPSRLRYCRALSRSGRLRDVFWLWRATFFATAAVHVMQPLRDLQLIALGKHRMGTMIVMATVAVSLLLSYVTMPKSN